MITPVRIRVRNIRSVADGEITLTPTGITALHGPVGSGKSTFLDALVWTLYGEVPGGLRQAEMRRTGADGHPCEAEVEFLHNGQTYTAQRGLKQRSTRGGVREEAYARWWTNGASGAGQAERQISPTKLTHKITELTGLSGRAYTGAFFIAQGELTGLAEGTPAQVQQLFEEQTGLGPLTKAVDQASTRARRAEELAAAMPGSREDTDQAREALDNAQQHAADLHDAQQETAATAAEAAARLSLAEQQVEAAQELRRAAEQARVDHARAEERARASQQRVDTLTAQVAAAGAEDTDADALTHRLQALRAAVSATEHAINQADDARRRSADADARARTAQDQAEALTDPELEGRIAQAQAESTAYEQQRGALKGEYTRLTRAITTLQTVGATACCPTCTQPVHDLETLITDLSAQIERCIVDGRTAKAKAEAITQLHASLLAGRERQAQTSARAAAARDEAAAAQQTATEANRTAAEHIETITGLLPAASPVADPDNTDSILKYAHHNIDRLARQVADAQHAQDLRAQLDAARAQFESTHDDLARIAANQVAVSDAELASAVSTLGTIRTEHTARAAAAHEADTRFQVAAERAALLAEAHDTAQSRMRAKADQLHQAHIIHQAAALLAALRRTLLAEYTAAVSQAATDVLTQITDRHIQFEIDESFVPRVHTAEGTVRPTRVLSGGEKATAALAFRLGITAQITGGNATGMIVADEITAAHDADTRQAVLTCLAELGWPALVVSHGEEITETAQQVISVRQPDETTGTVIVQAA
ncbi:AAA family ATPase [Streptomyces sp. NPDC058268]|uniref:AAA family ATPase n=1 Tax=Streptomyces sp. NPDC058268 TaxID=3346413 RepID=UPI0036E031A8